MTPESIEAIVRGLGGLLAYGTLAVVLVGIWRGTRRPTGETTGHFAGWLRSPLFYLIDTLLFIGLGMLLWRPIPLALKPWMHTAVLIAGALLYFPGLGLVLWGRLALGREYFVSTGLGAQLFAGHRLVTGGPYAIVRHPMYLGLLLGALGGLLLYQTWTMAAFLIFAPFTLLRARREEKVLAASFGEEWQAYCRRVPAVIPRLFPIERNRKEGSGT
jgi:protein-S-isoprenylcysteine O-methyltransferase Ste14